MLLIVGWLMVLAAMFGGFMYSGGKPAALIVVGEYIVILGIALGYLVASSPMSVLKDMIRKILICFKGSPYTTDKYMDMIKALYELLMVAREQGVVGIEEHVLQPGSSSIFTKYPSFVNDHHAVVFTQDALKPVIDGKIKGDHLKEVLMEDLDRMHGHHHQPVSILTKVSDALPGIGIVAAVLGIIITMGSIAGDKAEIGEHVAHALVGTFLGLLVSYGFMQPLITKIEFLNEDELAYMESIACMVASYASGSPPVMAAEAGRRVIPPDRQPTAESLEQTLKGMSTRK
jgi:chemotaxis protein MotA